MLGITLGTGLGGGLVSRNVLFGGDNSGAAEICMFRNRVAPQSHAEEGASIRAVRRIYAEASGTPPEASPDPYTISLIAQGQASGNAEAAREAYRRLGQVVGDVIAHSLTLTDGLVVIGGGLSKAWPLFMPALLKEVNGTYTDYSGREHRRLVQTVFNLQDAEQKERFLKGDTREIAVPRSTRRICFDSLSRSGVGISQLGTSEAAAIGAYAMALQHLAP